MTNLSGTNLNNGAAVGPQGEGRDSPSRFPKYPAYKDSGVEWLGEVPEGWILARGDAYLRSQAKVVSADYLGGKEVFHYSIPAVQATGDGQLEDGDEIDSSKLLVEQPQVLISKLNPRKNTVCLAGPREVVTVCSGEFVPLQSDCMDLKWVYYLVSSENFKKRLESLVESATRSHQRVNPSDILKFRGAFPLLAEQTQIARFLDHETARIDALIEEQQRLIELLKEKRQAVISHAVTKGLDPTVPMKDSGVEWLGEVPAHWCGVPIKYMALERGSLFLDGDWIESKDISSDGIRYITTGNVGEGAYKEQGAGFISEETFHSLRCTEVYEGDVLVSRLNSPIGRACVVPNMGCRVVTSVDNVIFRPDSKFHRGFIVYLFSSDQYFKNTGNLARGATMQRISRGLLGNIRVVVPSLEEQIQIARFLDEETACIDALIEEANTGVGLLQERRSALISAAVTGKIDVRGWQPPANTQAPDSAVAEAN